MNSIIDQASSLINESVGRSLQSTPVPEEEVHFIPVKASSLVEGLCDAIWETINQLTLKELSITKEDLVTAMKWLIDARIAYVSGIRTENIHPKDIEYPAMFGPVLSVIGKYVDEKSNVRLIPTLAEGKYLRFTEGGEDEQLIIGVNHSEKLPYLKDYGRVIAVLRSVGVPTCFGMPMAKETEDPTLYKLDIVDSILLGSTAEAPAPVTVFTRILLDMLYLSSLWGSARVRYTTVDACKRSFYDLVLKNINGPKVRT